MRRRACHRGGSQGVPCTCEMGNVYRFCEPIVLLILSRLGTAHGYQIAREAGPLSVTHAGLDSAAIYRSLRRLELAGCLTSSWDTDSGGPARRVYALTPLGRQHLAEWVQVMETIGASIGALVQEGRTSLKSRRPPASRMGGRSA